MTKSDGGPAFPIEMTGTPYAPGMSLRDWFAGQALMGLFSQAEIANVPSADDLAQIVYGMADAMIAERGISNE